MKSTLLASVLWFCAGAYLACAQPSPGSLNVDFGVSRDGVARFTFSNADKYNCVTETNDNGLLAGGLTKSFLFPGVGTNFVLTKLDSRGFLDGSFGNFSGHIFGGIQGATGNEVADVYANPDGSYLVLINSSFPGGVDSLTLVRISPSGNLDPSFNNNTGFTALHVSGAGYGGGPTRVNRGKKILVNQSLNRIYVGGIAGDGINGQEIALYRLEEDGKLDNLFGTNGGRLISVDGLTSTSEILNDMALTSGGDILLCGTSVGFAAPNWLLAKVDRQGDTGAGFAVIGATPSDLILNSVSQLANGQIVVSGTANTTTTSQLAIVNFDETGALLSYYPMSIPGSAGTSVADMKVISGNYFVSGYYIDAGTSQEMEFLACINSSGVFNTTVFPLGYITYASGRFVQSVLYNQGIALVGFDYYSGFPDQDLKFTHVLLDQSSVLTFTIKGGPSTIGVNKSATYHVYPKLPGVTYLWSFTSDSIFFLGSQTKDSVTMFFADFTPSGTLSCLVKSGSEELGNPVQSISVKQITSPADLLEPLNCEDSISTVCDATYIELVYLYNTQDSLRAFIYNPTNCDSRGGVSDFTYSAFDTLYLGNYFNMEVRAGGYNKDSIHVGVWIDFDNDGKFDMAEIKNEFVGSFLSLDSLVSIKNIFVPTDAELLGPVRLRVRLRPMSYGPFNSIEGCPRAAYEPGETEDYLLILDRFEKLEATNFITPNGDGQNDFFVIRGADNAQVNSNQLTVFDRFGYAVFDKKNYNNDWYGLNSEGEPLTPGTYYFLFTQEYNGEDPDVVNGFLEIRY